jgi:hypothetical protein
MNDYKYVVYATDADGDGMIQTLGSYDDVDEITIHAGMFKEDVVITIEKQYEKDR